MSTVVYPPFLIFKFGLQIRVQRPEKPLGFNLCETSSSQSQKNLCVPYDVNARFWHEQKCAPYGVNAAQGVKIALEG